MVHSVNTTQGNIRKSDKFRNQSTLINKPITSQQVDLIKSGGCMISLFMQSSSNYKVLQRRFIQAKKEKLLFFIVKNPSSKCKRYTATEKHPN